MDLTRRAGVLLHPTSLPGGNGIGELGPEAHRFVDWMADAGQTIWQVMPLGPTGYGDSPYQCFSAFAGNPLLISLDVLVEQRLLDPEDLAPLKKLDPGFVDYGRVIPVKNELLAKAFHQFELTADEAWQGRFGEFCRNHAGWLDDFALFMSLKQFYDGQVWADWPQPLRDREPEALARAHEEHADKVQFHRWLQFNFFEQWWEVRRHANEKGIVLLGDLPIFVAYDCVDVWANRNLFHLDEKGHSTVVAGVPPDYFSKTGQRWGNPLYKWDAHQEQGFGWWEARFRTTLETVDWIRIDHFRGFAGYWEIPASEPTAVNGRWVGAPGQAFFETLRSRMGDPPLIAEDLGVITPDVVELRKRFGFPGMRVLQFAWGSGPDNSFLPHNHEPDSVVYTGTHDNNTTVGWLEQESTGKMRSQIARYVGHGIGQISEEFIRLANASVAAFAVAPMQDLLGLGADARMNTPGNANGNWSWRVMRKQLTAALAGKMRKTAELYGRLPGSNGE